MPSVLADRGTGIFQKRQVRSISRSGTFKSVDPVWPSNRETDNPLTDGPWRMGITIQPLAGAANGVEAIWPKLPSAPFQDEWTGAAGAGPKSPFSGTADLCHLRSSVHRKLVKVGPASAG